MNVLIPTAPPGAVLIGADVQEFKRLKRRFGQHMPTVSLSHIQEALAAGFGFRTYRGLLDAFQGNPNRILHLDHERFNERLKELILRMAAEQNEDEDGEQN